MKSYGPKLAEQAAALSTDADTARDLLNSIDVMETAIADPNFMSGVLQDPLFDSLRGLAERFNIIAEGTTSANELFRAISNKAVLERLGGSLGHQISDRDREFIKQTMANLNVTPEGNRKILAIMKRIAEREIETEEAWNGYFAEWQSSGDPKSSYLDFRQRWRTETEKEENTLFPEQFKKDLEYYALEGEWPVTNEEVDDILAKADKLREHLRLMDAAGIM